jgi:hypothetical protein
MRKLLPVLLILAIPLLFPRASSAWAAQTGAIQANSASRFTGDCRLEVLVNGAPRPEYSARGVTYIEALRSQGYEIRLTNPYGVRVAVALSVDGLNTLDARHTAARSARKWVLDPYQTIVLRGWQTSGEQARRFFFTSEQNSYGQWLGKTENLGIISAVFFRERVPIALRQPMRILPAPPPPPKAEAAPQPSGVPQGQAGGVGGALDRKESPNLTKQQEDYAATGIGQAENHPVTLVYMDLEDSPASVVTIRYEYRPALIALGILPEAPTADPLHRREKARGFVDNGYCPSPR